MSEDAPKPVGSIVWTDLTVPDAGAICDFYREVVGWTTKPHSMGDYDDQNILDADGHTVAGICHARGSNANIPPAWLVYVKVADAAASAERCTQNGGEVLDGPRKMGNGTFVVIKDPAGAVLGLIDEG